MAVNRNTRIGEYFVLGEFVDRRAARLPPPETHIALAQLCCLVLDPIRRRFGVTTINSGYRTAQTNDMVGGASRSYHLYDERPDYPAVDFSCEQGTPRRWAAICEEVLRGSGGLGVYRSHVHVDRRPQPGRWDG